MPTDAPRLLFVGSDAPDFLDYRIGLAEALRKSGFEVHVALPSGGDVEAIARRGFRVHAIPLRRLSVRPWTEARTCAALLRLYVRLRPVLVHHLCLKPVLYGAAAARVAGVPAAIHTLTGLGPIFTMRTPKLRALRGLVERGLRFGLRHPNTRVVVQNPADRDFL